MPPAREDLEAGHHDRPWQYRWVRIARLGSRALAWIAGGVALYAAVGRRRQLTWGATPAEVDAMLPGDERLASADLVATRSIAVRATAAEVWPWLVQMGQGRGGLYSYDRLENIVGCEIHSADRIVPEWQSLVAGDPFRIHPQVALRVCRVDPGEALVVEGAVSPSGEATTGSTEAPYDFTWAFVLVPAEDDTTRLIIRERYRYRAPWVWLMVEPVAAVSFVMTERMLRGIRDRAEHAAASSERPTT